MDNWYMDHDEEYGDLQDDEESELLMALAKLIEEEDARPAIINPLGMARIMDAYSLLNGTLEGENVKVTCKLHEPFKSFGSISIEGKDIVVTDTERFGRAVLLTSNFEVYPLTNGMIRFSLGFQGLTKPLV